MNIISKVTLLLALSCTTSLSAQIEAAKPWLGVAIDQGSKGVLVKDVIADTPAAQVDLRKGDEITAIDDIRVKGPEELIKAVQAQGVGNKVTVHYLRDGKPSSKPVQLVARPDQLELLKQKLVGKPVPPFDLKVIAGPDGGKLEALKGKVVILEFWATWCPACRATHAELSTFAAKHRGDGLAVLAVSDEDEATLNAYAKQFKPDFTILQDTAQVTHKDWLVSAIPELAVIDRKGNVTFVTIGGGVYLDQVMREAEKALAAK